MYFKKNEEGSTLLLIMITVAILTMLGTALLAMSFMNINMKQGDLRIKQTAYYAESGIDQVYARIGYLVEEAIGEAVTLTDVQMQAILEDIYLIQTGQIPLDSSNEIYVDKTNPDDITVKMTLVQTKAEELYKENFKSTFDGYYTSGDMADELWNTNAPDYVYLDSNDNTNGSLLDITIDSVETFSSSGSTFTFKGVKSVFDLSGVTEKEIITDIVVSDSIIAYPFSSLENRIIVMDNPLWQKAIVALGDVGFDDSDATVNGDVFGYGTVPADTNYAEAVDYGGILVAGSSDVTVNGHMASRSYIQLAQNSTGDLTVNDGMVYTNSLIIQKGADGDIVINNGNVYTSDDLEMNGDGSSSVTINGSYYGYADGSSGGGVASHDISSAIVLNSDMTQASLTITGDALTGSNLDYNEYYTDSGTGTKQPAYGAIIAGTGYVDTYDGGSNSKRYQTGESVAFKGNYIAYSWAFDQSVIDSVLLSNEFMVGTSGNYPLYARDTTGSAPVDSIHDEHVTNFLQKENVAWDTYFNQLGTVSVNFATASTVSGSGSVTLNDRMAYFAAFKEYINDGGGLNYIKSGAGANVNIDSIFYAAGLQLDSSGDFEYDTSNFSEFDSELRPVITGDNTYMLHNLENRPFVPTGDLTDVGSEFIPTLAGVDEEPTVANANPYEKYTNLDLASVSYNFWEYTLLGAVGEIRHISDSTATLYLYGTGTANPSPDATHISLGRTTNQGIILHRGDIHIYGDFEFTGPIISEGDVFLHDGTQVLTNGDELSKRYLADLIYSDDRFYDVFQVTNYGDSTTPDIALTDYEFTEIDSSVTHEDGSNSNLTFFDWIYFEHWRIAK